MKQIRVFALLAGFLTTLAACKKPWDCVCLAPNDAPRIVQVEAVSEKQAWRRCEKEALPNEGCELFED